MNKSLRPQLVRDIINEVTITLALDLYPAQVELLRKNLFEVVSFYIDDDDYGDFVD